MTAQELSAMGGLNSWNQPVEDEGGARFLRKRKFSFNIINLFLALRGANVGPRRDEQLSSESLKENYNEKFQKILGIHVETEEKLLKKGYL